MNLRAFGFIVFAFWVCLPFFKGNFLPVFAADSYEEVIVGEAEIEFGNPTEHDSAKSFTDAIIDAVFTFCLAIAVLILVYGGFLFITAAGDPQKVETGKKLIFYALIGVGIVVLAKGLVWLLYAIIMKE